MTDHVLVAALVALTLGLGTACWYVSAMPDVFLSLWERDEDDWPDEAPGAALGALRWITAALLLTFAFASGFALIFLSSAGD